MSHAHLIEMEPPFNFSGSASEIYQFGRATTCSYVNYDAGIIVIKRHCG